MDRKAIFISHATPEGNEFTLWLGAKLSAMGYEVWADILKLSGGDDWESKLEDALRNRACKVLLVADANSVAKRGVRNEITIAVDVAKKLRDDSFIIPLRLASFDAPFLIAHAQYINFEKSWAQGLKELLLDLDEVYAVPRSDVGDASIWQNLQGSYGKTLIAKSELLISNWVAVSKLPKHIFYYGPGLSNEERKRLRGFPLVPFGSGFISCERSLTRGGEGFIATVKFLKDGCSSWNINQFEARKMFVSLVRQGLDCLFEQRGLSKYEMSNGIAAWWVPSTEAKGKIRFDWGEFRGLRQIQGISAKRRVHWHFGVSTDFRSYPFNCVRVKSRLIFTEDNGTPVSNANRMHSLRRSFAKGWRNPRWRDMLLAFLHWLSDGNELIAVPINASDELELRLPPMMFNCPVGIAAETLEAEDEDDPDLEYDFEPEEDEHV
ncbi:MAG: toll/interleukin-1 receptor domain-containing protein [Acidobacteriota bacterium]